jgi:hypothetical protein
MNPFLEVLVMSISRRQHQTAGCLMNVEQLVELEFAGETKVLGDNSPLCHCVHRKFYMILPGIVTGHPWWEAGD